MEELVTYYNDIQKQKLQNINKYFDKCILLIRKIKFNHISIFTLLSGSNRVYIPYPWKIKYESFFISFFCFSFVSVFSQKNDTLYFLVNKKDTLITKLTNSSSGNHIGYRLTDEKRIKKLNKTPLVEGKVWVPESDDDFHTFGPSFSFNSSKDTVVTKSYLNSLKIIKNRIELEKLCIKEILIMMRINILLPLLLLIIF